MALGYLIAQIDVHDLDAYSKYTAQTPGIAADYGGKFIVRAGQCEALEGPAPGPRVVMIEFPSYARAKEFYYSDEYQAIVGVRHGASTGSAFVVEGAD